MELFGVLIGLFSYSIRLKIRPPETGFASRSLTKTFAPMLKLVFDVLPTILFFSVLRLYLSPYSEDIGMRPSAPVSLSRINIPDFDSPFMRASNSAPILFFKNVAKYLSFVSLSAIMERRSVLLKCSPIFTKLVSGTIGLFSHL